MIALSTSWKSNQIENGEALVEALTSYEVTGVELEYRITGKMFDQMRVPLKNSGLDIVSIHNYFPAPMNRKGWRPGGDMLSLSDLDRDKRNLAVRQTIRTFEVANDLMAPLVVLHCGFVEIETDMPTLRDWFRSGRIHNPEATLFIEKMKNRLSGKKDRHLDSLFFSLDRLAITAEKLGITFALENRYYYHELPGFYDFQSIFSELDGAPLGYWHDTGHAHANERLGLIPNGGLLEKYGNRLVGAHLHDANGLDDHLAPGSGEIDFDPLKACLKPGTPLVMELAPGTPDSEVKAGIRYLRDSGFGETDDTERD